MGLCVSKYETDPGFLFFLKVGSLVGFFLYAYYGWTTYAGDGEKPMLEIASDVDGKLVFETTAEREDKPDT